jgi:tripartite-type tricarboxylate transporter receptor subunit TctC
VAKLAEAVNAALKNPEMRAHLQGLSPRPVGGTPNDMAELMKADTRLLPDVIKAQCDDRVAAEHE